MEIYLATRMTSVVYTFMNISPPRGCIIIWYRIRMRNATRSRVAANDDGLLKINWVQCLNRNRALTVPGTAPDGIEFGAVKARCPN